MNKLTIYRKMGKKSLRVNPTWPIMKKITRFDPLPNSSKPPILPPLLQMYIKTTIREELQPVIKIYLFESQF